MIRILAMSDLHLEFSWFAPELTSWPDLIILAGDIGYGSAGVDFARQQIPDSVPVVVLAGNHEFYESSIEAVTERIRTAADATRNIYFLDRNEVKIPIAGREVRILGATLWTDFALRGEAMRSADMVVASKRLNDFRLIKYAGRILTPRDTIDFHETARDWLDSKLAEPYDGPTIIATHHSPSERSEQPRYVGGELSAAFHSNLEWTIAKHQPNLWIHGHSHWSVDYMIGRTRIFSNQRGYPREQCGFQMNSIEL
jgi:Icc-related predicted phosphoesterase